MDQCHVNPEKTTERFEFLSFDKKITDIEIENFLKESIFIF